MASEAAASESLTVEVARTERRVIVRLVGVFDAPGVAAFSSAVSPLLYERRQPAVVIDVGSLTHLSGSGLGAIVFAVQFARGHGQSCRVRRASGQPAAILSTVALTRQAMSSDALGTVN